MKKKNNNNRGFLPIVGRDVTGQVGAVVATPGIAVSVTHTQLERVGNWAGPRDLFPTIVVDQATSQVQITYYSVSNGRRGQWGLTHEHHETISDGGQVLKITGLTGLRNDRRGTGGRQKFCFFVFRGDSGHFYTHRATASKGWIGCPPETLLARLRKLGIGADKGVIQQGDFLLKPANGHAYPADDFRHETMGAGHHKFVAPVLYADGDCGRQYRITESLMLCHEALDGIKHPDVTIPPGVWIVGTTSLGLRHANQRD